jgi:hypothetical protein
MIRTFLRFGEALFLHLVILLVNGFRGFVNLNDLLKGKEKGPKPLSHVARILAHIAPLFELRLAVLQLIGCL